MRVCDSSSQHAAQPRPGRTDTAEGGDGDIQEGQRTTCPRAQPPKTELRGAETTAQSGPEGVGRTPTAATAGTIYSHTQRQVCAVAAQMIRFTDMAQMLQPIYAINCFFTKHVFIPFATASHIWNNVEVFSSSIFFEVIHFWSVNQYFHTLF